MRGQLTQRFAAVLAAGLGVLALAAAGGAPAIAQEGCKDAKPQAADPGVTPVKSGYQFVGTGDPLLPIRLSNQAGTKWCPVTSFIFSSLPSWVLPYSQGSWAPELKNNIVVAPKMKKQDIVVYSAVPNEKYAMEQNEKRKQNEKREKPKKLEPLPRCIGVAIRDHGTKDFINLQPICSSRSKKGRFIDPTIFANRNGRTYLLYKEDPRPPKKQRRGHLVSKVIVIRKIIEIKPPPPPPPAPAPPSAPTLELGPPKRILRAHVDGQGKPDSWEGVSVEAPTMVKHGSKYYLFYSGGNFTTKNYGVGVAMSGSPYGRFERIGGRPIIGGKRDSVANRRCGVGHQDVTHKRGVWRIYFHASDMVRNDCRVSEKGRYLVVKSLKWVRGKPRPGRIKGKKPRPGKGVVASTASPPPSPAPAPAPARPPAQDICVMHPSEASVVCVRNAGHAVDVCDRENDAHRVYARVITEASNPNFESPFYDDNGSNAGCGNFTFPSRVLSVSVCVQTEGCSAFKPT